MLRIEIESADAAARIEQLPQGVADALAQKMEDLGAALLDRVEANVSGLALNSRTGALARSLYADVAVDDGAVVARVGSDGSVPYAAIQEYGGRTSAHDIAPDKASVLAFLLGGKQIFARLVHHPGSQIPARSYLRSALADAGPDILAALQEALRDGVEAPAGGAP